MSAQEEAEVRRVDRLFELACRAWLARRGVSY
jgi:hypothetical protein